MSFMLTLYILIAGIRRLPDDYDLHHMDLLRGMAVQIFKSENYRLAFQVFTREQILSNFILSLFLKNYSLGFSEIVKQNYYLWDPKK